MPAETRHRPTAPDSVTLEAARWFVLLASGEARPIDHERCAAWRGHQVAHERAWQRVQTMRSPFDAVSPALAPAAAHALEGAHGHRRRSAMKHLAVLLAGGLGGWTLWRAAGMPDGEASGSLNALTLIGERRTIELADGSRMTLDSDTLAEVVFDEHQRLLKLRRGRILVETATDVRERRFMVQTLDGRATALGTRFTVEVLQRHTRVAVLQARVMVEPVHAGQSIVLSAGESARFDGAAVLARDAVDANDEAWQRGMLVADDMPLGDFVAALARHRAAPLVCDARVRDLRISGAYALDDAPAALRAVARVLPVRLETGTDGALALRPR